MKHNKVHLYRSWLRDIYKRYNMLNVIINSKVSVYDMYFWKGLVFSQGWLPKWKFPNKQLPECANFPCGNFPNVRSGLLWRHRLQNRIGKRALRQGQTWEIATSEIAYLGSHFLGKYPWEVIAHESTLHLFK